MSRNTKIILTIICVAALMALAPLMILPDAEFSGSDDAGSEMVEEISGEQYTPWAGPVLERIMGRELPGEAETMFFCIQTGIGVGIIAFCFGYFVARKKYLCGEAER